MIDGQTNRQLDIITQVDRFSDRQIENYTYTYMQIDRLIAKDKKKINKQIEKYRQIYRKQIDKQTDREIERQTDGGHQTGSIERYK